MKGLNLNNVFSKTNYNANFVRRKTHRNADSDTQTSTLILLRQRLYPTSEVPLKLSLVHYSLTTYALHTNRYPLNDDYLLMSRTKTNRSTDRERYTGSNAATASLITLVKPAETSAREGLNTNDRTHMLSKPQAGQTHVAREGCNVIYITYVTRRCRVTDDR